MGEPTRGRDLASLSGLVAVLLAVLLWPYVVDGYGFGVGPDVPVYLWWTRVGASEGLSVLGSRPGAPALAAALAGTLDLNVAAVTAALGSALGVAVGAAAAAFVRAAGGRPARAWWVAGVLAGVFSVHLVAGYLANLVLAAPFLAAAACLAGRRRSWWAAALLLGGGGLAHPPFLVHGIVILAGAAARAWRAGARDEARDVALAASAGGLVAGAGVLAVLAGPGPIDAPTSKDAYLRRAGLDATLVDAYRERLRLRAARYVQWISVPLALPGVAIADGFLQRFLVSWLVVMVVAVPLGWITGWFPPDRIVTFGFAVPIAAALGLLWLRDRLERRPWLARAAVAGLAGWMIVGALLAWGRQEPFIAPAEARLAGTASILGGLYTSPGTPIVFVVDDDDATATFLASRAANIVRGAAFPGRAADIRVFVGTATDFFDGHPTRRGNAQYDALSRLSFADIPHDPEPLVFVIAPFYRVSSAEPDPRLSQLEPGLLSSRADFPTPSMAATSGALAWGRSSPAGIAASTIVILVLLAVLGLGYAVRALDDTITALAASPAFGTAAVTLTAVALDAVGLRLEGLGVALAASALAGLGGLALLVAKRQRDRPPTT